MPLDAQTPAMTVQLQGALVSALSHYPQSHAEIHKLSFVGAAFFLTVFRVEVCCFACHWVKLGQIDRAASPGCLSGLFSYVLEKEVREQSPVLVHSLVAAVFARMLEQPSNTVGYACFFIFLDDHADLFRLSSP